MVERIRMDQLLMQLPKHIHPRLALRDTEEMMLEKVMLVLVFSVMDF